MSGAFSAFRKSTILKTQLYNTETVCEDTHVTFQVRKLLHQKIAICENAVFFVDPIENLQSSVCKDNDGREENWKLPICLWTEAAW